MVHTKVSPPPSNDEGAVSKYSSYCTGAIYYVRLKIADTILGLLVNLIFETVPAVRTALQQFHIYFSVPNHLRKIPPSIPIWTWGTLPIISTSVTGTSVSTFKRLWTKGTKI